MIKYTISEIISSVSSFSLLEIVTQNDCPVLLHLGLEIITKFETDQKVRFVYFKFTPSNDRVLCVYTPSGYIGPGNSWLRGVSLKDYKIIWKIKMRETKLK